MKTFILIIACAAIFAGSNLTLACHAQSIKLLGVVTDAQTGNALRGANISVENSFYGTITNETGDFRIAMAASMPLPVTVVCERLGYTPVTLQVTDPAQPLKVTLKPLGMKEKEAQQASAGVAEYKVKINLIRLMAEKTSFTNALETASKPFTIAVIGYNPFGEDLFAFEKILIKGRKVQVVFLSDATEIADQEVLIVSKPGRKLQEEVQAQLVGKSILTICDNFEQKELQPVFTLETAEGKVRFRLNETAEKAAGLIIGDDLRKAAVIQ